MDTNNYIAIMCVVKKVHSVIVHMTLCYTKSPSLRQLNNETENE